ncbi:hypothetical protein BDK51DRAFT_44084, partial [Blyttiomyces helicus]
MPTFDLRAYLEGIEELVRLVVLASAKGTGDGRELLSSAYFGVIVGGGSSDPDAFVCPFSRIDPEASPYKDLGLRACATQGIARGRVWSGLKERAELVGLHRCLSELVGLEKTARVCGGHFAALSEACRWPPRKLKDVQNLTAAQAGSKAGADVPRPGVPSPSPSSSASSTSSASSGALTPSSPAVARKTLSLSSASKSKPPLQKKTRVVSRPASPSVTPPSTSRSTVAPRLSKPSGTSPADRPDVATSRSPLSRPSAKRIAGKEMGPAKKQVSSVKPVPPREHPPEASITPAVTAPVVEALIPDKAEGESFTCGKTIPDATTVLALTPLPPKPDIEPANEAKISLPPAESPSKMEEVRPSRKALIAGPPEPLVVELPGRRVSAMAALFGGAKPAVGAPSPTSGVSPPIKSPCSFPSAKSVPSPCDSVSLQLLQENAALKARIAVLESNSAQARVPLPNDRARDEERVKVELEAARAQILALAGEVELAKRNAEAAHASTSANALCLAADMREWSDRKATIEDELITSRARIAALLSEVEEMKRSSKAAGGPRPTESHLTARLGEAMADLSKARDELEAFRRDKDERRAGGYAAAGGKQADALK